MTHRIIEKLHGAVSLGIRVNPQNQHYRREVWPKMLSDHQTYGKPADKTNFCLRAAHLKHGPKVAQYGQLVRDIVQREGTTWAQGIDLGHFYGETYGETHWGKFQMSRNPRALIPFHGV